MPTIAVSLLAAHAATAHHYDAYGYVFGGILVLLMVVWAWLAWRPRSGSQQ